MQGQPMPAFRPIGPRIGLRIEVERDVTLADGRKVKAGSAGASVEINDREMGCQ